MNYGCIGEHLCHSFSPEIHRLIGRYDYELREVPKDELGTFMKAREFRGINVTIPYKQVVIPYLDRISDTAAAIGAVNTVVNRNGVLWGYNTDSGGMQALIRRMQLNLSGKKVLILGTGGTSRTALAVAGSLGAMEVLRVSRRKTEGVISYDEAITSHADADVIINTTPRGMYPDVGSCPIDLSRFVHLSGVVDAIFNPISSRLVLTARELGIPAAGGLYMLVSQAVAAAELFTGAPCEPGVADRIYRQLLRQKGNLVLIGMPGSGKTSVGRRAAELLNRPFIDLDEVISNRAGKPIPDIFSQDGEAVFRRIESGIVREISSQNGLVIATGGGCVLCHENVENLRMNGRLIFLDRPLGELVPTADRPLADSRRKMEYLYKARHKIYQAAADATVPVTGDIGHTAAAAIEVFCEE